MHLATVCRCFAPGELVEKGLGGMFAIEHAFQGKLDRH